MTSASSDREAVVDGSTAVVGVSGADEAAKMMNSDVPMVPVDQDIDTTSSMVVMQVGTVEDGTAPDGGGDGHATTSACKFSIGFNVNQADTDVVEENRHQGTKAEGDAIHCACLDNLDGVDHEQVPETTDCCDEENPDLEDDLEVDRSFPKVVVVDQNMLPVYEMCSDDDDDDNDVVEQFSDVECADHACENEDEACCDTVSDSVAFEANSDEVGEELPTSQSDSKLCRLPVRLDAVQELSDSGSDDVLPERSSGIDVDLLAVSSPTSMPTSPASDSSLTLPEHMSSATSPDSSSKPPTGAVVLRRSPRSESAEMSPKSPEFANVQGHNVELRPPKMTKRVSSFRKSLIK